MKKSYSCIIVGAGSIGIATGYYLAKQGIDTLLIDAYDPPHQMGSHHGDTRIIRYAYAEGKQYVPLALRARELWNELEQDAEEIIFSPTGVLSIGNPDAGSMREILSSVQDYSLPLDILDASQVEQHWPGIVMPEDFVGYFEAEAGVLFSEKCIKSYRMLAKRYGATIVTHSPVEQIRFDASGIAVQTKQDTYYGEYVLVTAGAWTEKVLRTVELSLPLQPTRKAIGWFEADERLYRAQHFPAFIFNLPTETYYGFPSFEQSGLKIGCHHGGQKVDPHHFNRQFGDDVEDEGKLRQFLEKYMPNAAGSLKRGSTCLYTLSPDEHFIIDSHPNQAKLILAAGFSGHGFKFASSIGEGISQLIITGTSNLDLSMFSLHRFTTTP